ncbi:MAG: serine/threonine-protein kinase [Myxococcota bacterium]
MASVDADASGGDLHPAPTPVPLATPRYKRLERIGEGGFGVVYRAWDVTYGTEVALKTLPRVRHEHVEALKDEFRRAADLSHPNLVAMYDLVVAPPLAFFTMELVTGARPDLTQRHAPDAIESLAVQVLDGLAALHGAGLVHRDVKPSNLVVEPGGRVVLLDYGLARPPGELQSLAGTFSYMAPEMFSGGRLGPAVDLYALGIVLVELARGERWTAGVPGAWDLEGLALPDRLRDLVAACLATDPRDRPTARDARAGLRAPRPRGSGAPRGPLRRAPRRGVQLLGALGRGRVVRVEGAPGIGKTRLVEQMLGGRLLAGRCHPCEAVPSTASTARSPRWGCASRAPRPSRRRTSRRACSSGGAATPRTPSGIDDAQWLDRDSLAVLRALVEADDVPPVVIGHRPLAPGHPLRAEPWFGGTEAIAVGPRPTATPWCWPASSPTPPPSRWSAAPAATRCCSAASPASATTDLLTLTALADDDLSLAATLLRRAAWPRGRCPSGSSARPAPRRASRASSPA